MGVSRYVYSGGKRLRCGYTTGSCAAAAAKAAAVMLGTGEAIQTISLITPSGVSLLLEVEDIQIDQIGVRCAVRKDAGDDADVTDGILVYARVSRTDGTQITVDGGEGVGRVTCKGLEQPIGAAAINSVPRRMIADAVREVLSEGGVQVTISVPQGRQIAQKTYNPRLGIEGGISILGTTGIVEPMSGAALVDTIRVELKMRRAQGDAPILLTPGNYGETFSRESLGIVSSRSVICSNFVGDALDFAVQQGFRGILLVGHIGKLIKLAAGIFNTHSRVADARQEILTAHAALAGADYAMLCALMRCITTNEALDLLEAEGILAQVLSSLIGRIEQQLEHRTGGYPMGVVLFSNTRGVLAQSKYAQAFIEQMKGGNQVE